MRRFVIVSGLPGSGKTTLARRLAPALDLPLLDKDDILERLFEAKGIGDEAWRRTLSRQSDAIFQREAQASNGAILTSFWRLPGMPADLGTPTDWLPALSDPLVQVYCSCDPATAAERYFRRTRHQGHLDAGASHPEVLARIRSLSAFGYLEIGERVIVDTSHEPDLDEVVRQVRDAFNRPR